MPSSVPPLPTLGRAIFWLIGDRALRCASRSLCASVEVGPSSRYLRSSGATRDARSLWHDYTVGASIGDVVVVVPGIMGSTLSRRRHGSLIPIWAPSAGGLINALATFGGSIRSLALPEDLDDGDPHDGIVATGLMPGIHAIPGLWSGSGGYSRLVKWLRETFSLVPHRPSKGTEATPHACGNLVCFAYDWRLSCRRNALRLRRTIEPVLTEWRARHSTTANARLVFICHSMGGLVARWYVEQLGGAEVTRKLITIGTPHRGSIKALDGLVNGIHKGVGPFGITLTDAVRTFPAMYELLPAYKCIQCADGLRALHDVSIPDLDVERVRRARFCFHDRLDANPTRETLGYDLHPILGTRQPTWTTARIESGRIVPSTLIEGNDLAGDGTVPRLAALPRGVSLDSNVIIGVSEQHGTLQHHRAVLEQLYTVLTGTERVYMDDNAGAPTISLHVEPVYFLGRSLPIRVTASSDDVRLRVTLTDEAGELVGSELLWRDSECSFSTEFEALPEGGYEICVGRDGPGANPVKPVTACTLVWDSATATARA